MSSNEFYVSIFLLGLCGLGVLFIVYDAITSRLFRGKKNDRIREAFKALLPGAVYHRESDKVRSSSTLRVSGQEPLSEMQYHPSFEFGTRRHRKTQPHEVKLVFKSSIQLRFNIERIRALSLFRPLLLWNRKRHSSNQIEYFSFFPSRSMNYRFQCQSMNRTATTRFLSSSSVQSMIETLLKGRVVRMSNRSGKLEVVYEFANYSERLKPELLRHIKESIASLIASDAWKELQNNDHETELSGPICFAGPNAFGGTMTRL